MRSKKHCRYIFKGRDWTELAEAWGLEADEDEILERKILDYMYNQLDHEKDEWHECFIDADIQDFLGAASHCTGVSQMESNIYSAVSMGESATEVYQWFARNLRSIWV